MRSLRITALTALLALPFSAFAASTLTGTITNGTTNKPSSGDTVTLIRLAQGMQEAAHTTSDGKGHYELNVPDDGVHLVRVTHEGANYFKPAPPGTTALDIDVYAVAAKVPGVKLEADVMRVQTEADGKSLRVVQHFFLKNESAPPKTQFSDATFDFTLPEGAVVEGAAAQGPGGMTVQSQPVPLTKKGHFTFNFAVRPGGQTQFQVSYRVPYNGSLKMTPTTAMASDNVIVMMPKAMKFDGGKTPWAPVQDEVDAQTFVARNIAGGDTAEFTLSGQGQLPRTTTTASDASQQNQGNGPATGTPASGADPNADPGSNTGPAASNKPGGGLGTPIDTPDPLSKYKWWIIAGVALLLISGAGFLLGRPQNPAVVTTDPTIPSTAAPVGVAIAAGIPQAASLLNVLRDELFTLESDRLTGKITEEQYARVKPALEVVLQNALERNKPSA
ncbi:hypothetical protein Terro_2501 [Terriglobus roseus DSM 18391]|uniref:Carboxypeptidase regulatory-like domain-containing protein n=1 Tax=Terriglobus roseus (strain DSM 18391 / NRRL B-41598 / KBS 63) TaxID=926566 RepID=I3ZGP0_TERRK|nr:hypothetical protein [Terriglobus roseus]AFL88408.1 hypothetical protein Terro_2137 [Terriglobus roseus DSM 18391]AFL88749.1 hypothetical protein Terro_2501 [Terriglobus roseus DSM 18391]